MTKILIKRLSKQVLLPKYETVGSSGMDLAANNEFLIKIEPGKTSIVPTGISLAIPRGFEVQIRPRSGLAAKKSISVLIYMSNSSLKLVFLLIMSSNNMF